MLRKPESVISALRKSKVYVPSVNILHEAAPALFSHQDKSDADAIVKDYEGKQYSLESSLLEGFSACNLRAAAAAMAAAWSVEIEGKISRPAKLALVPSPRRSLLAARATVLGTLATLGLSQTPSWGSLRPNPEWDNTGAELADVTVRQSVSQYGFS